MFSSGEGDTVIMSTHQVVEVGTIYKSSNGNKMFVQILTLNGGLKHFTGSTVPEIATLSLFYGTL